MLVSNIHFHIVVVVIKYDIGVFCKQENVSISCLMTTMYECVYFVATHNGLSSN